MHMCSTTAATNPPPRAARCMHVGINCTRSTCWPVVDAQCWPVVDAQCWPVVDAQCWSVVDAQRVNVRANSSISAMRPPCYYLLEETVILGVIYGSSVWMVCNPAAPAGPRGIPWLSAERTPYNGLLHVHDSFMNVHRTTACYMYTTHS